MKQIEAIVCVRHAGCHVVKEGEGINIQVRSLFQVKDKDKDLELAYIITLEKKHSNVKCSSSIQRRHPFQH